MTNKVEWLIRDRLVPLTRTGLVMGIVNVTLDSFSDGGRYAETDKAVDHALRLVAEGAGIIDVGGESTRPGAEPVSEEEEMQRVLPVVQRLRPQTSALISVDTFKANVAKAALDAGADIINDITGLRGDPLMPQIAATSRAGVVVMHMQGMPRTMQVAPHYEDVVEEVLAFFRERVTALLEAGVERKRIVLDPGIGFGKLLEHNLALLRATPRFCALGHPILIGASRKSLFGQILGSKSLKDRHWPSVAITSWTRELGATLHRVHDVAACTQALRMTEAILYGYQPKPKTA
jgi:dihydropteroate synthase